MGVISWLDRQGQIHLRVYSLQPSNGKLVERRWDSNELCDGELTRKNFDSISGAGATSWLDPRSGQVHIRVYVVGTNGKIMEYCWDKNKWYSGYFSNQFYGSSTPDATSWTDANGKVHIRVYAYNQDYVPKEYAWDGTRWSIGPYTE